MNESLAAFWIWWTEARARLEHAIENRGWKDELVEEITARVQAIGEAMLWSVCPGQKSRHAFCLSAAADPTLRPLAERWRRAAPPADELWEFHGARLPQPGIAVMVGDLLVEPKSVRVAFALDPARERVDVKVFHPGFAEIPDEMRQAASMVALESTFGEDGVERWIGYVEVANEEPAGALGLAELETAVVALAKTATGEKFALLEGEDDSGKPVFVAVNQAAKRVDHILCDHHVEVEIEADDAREDALIEKLNGAAVFVAHETIGPARWLHFYAPAEAEPAFEKAGVAARFAFDPLWQTLSCFTDALRQ
jgi:hypothetical protein